MSYHFFCWVALQLTNVELIYFLPVQVATKVMSNNLIIGYFLDKTAIDELLKNLRSKKKKSETIRKARSFISSRNFWDIP